ncbi:hypothetical protein ACNKHV_25985 [Shigella flexneri]
MLTLMVTSKRDCWRAGVSFVVLLATLGSVGIRWKVWRLLPVLTCPRHGAYCAERCG